MCFHNVSVALKKASDLDLIFDRQKFGIADTSLALIWPEVIEKLSHAKIVVLRRPIDEVLYAMTLQGYDPRAVEGALRRIDFALDEIESLSGVLKVKFDDLFKEPTAKRLFEFCLPYKFDPDWWAIAKSVIVEQDQQVLQAKLAANAVGYNNVFGQACAYYDGRLKQKVFA
jgi:hypothetical protein